MFLKDFDLVSKNAFVVARDILHSSDGFIIDKPKKCLKNDI